MTFYDKTNTNAKIKWLIVIKMISFKKTKIVFDRETSISKAEETSNIFKLEQNHNRHNDKKPKISFLNISISNKN